MLARASPGFESNALLVLACPLSALAFSVPVVMGPNSQRRQALARSSSSRARSVPSSGSAAGQQRASVPPGTAVQVVQKHHQGSGELTKGVVARNLTSSGFHPRGQKVLLVSGIVGRVQAIVTGAAAAVAAAAAAAAVSPAPSEGEAAFTNTFSESTNSSHNETHAVTEAAQQQQWSVSPGRSVSPRRSVSPNKQEAGRSWVFENGQLVNDLSAALPTDESSSSKPRRTRRRVKLDHIG
eukprot:16978-Heterococcus_DN1.PRE.2